MTADPKFEDQHQRGQRCGERLIGTCNSIESEAEDGDNFESVAFCEGIDDVAFECNECGWWYETGEAHEGPDGDVCSQCYEGED